MFSPVGLNPKLGSANWLGHITILESFFLFLTNRPPNLLLQATLRVMPVLVTFTLKRMFTKFVTHNAVLKFLKRYTSSPVPTCKTCSLWHFPKVKLQSLNFKPFVSVTVQDTTWRPPLATCRLLLTYKTWLGTGTRVIKVLWIIDIRNRLHYHNPASWCIMNIVG
jgi:hypothetical protein